MLLVFQGRFRLTSGFRLPDRPGHNGIDLVGEEDKTVYCPVKGVVKSSTIVTDRSDLTWEWGHYVRIDDKDGNRLYFCHLDSRLVAVGQALSPGDKIGVMGNTGKSFGAHLHFEVRRPDGKSHLDPAKYLGMLNAKGNYATPGWVKIGGKLYFYQQNGKLLVTNPKGELL